MSVHHHHPPPWRVGCQRLSQNFPHGGDYRYTESMKAIDADYEERYLLPPSIEDWVGPEHPARFIREVVDQMDLSELGIGKKTASEGRPPYSRYLLLRVWLYGYWKKIRSTRKLEEACREDVGFIWLCGGHQPDHNTLWRFFRQNRQQLRGVFKQTVTAALEMDLVGLVLQAVDGTRIQALCSGHARHRTEDLEKLQSILDEEIAKLERSIEEANQQSRNFDGELPERLRNRQTLRDKVAQALSQARAQGREYAHPQDPQARRMKCEGRNRFSYNAQAVVDSDSQIIVAEQVINDETDYQSLVPMIEEARENTAAVPTTLADSGYSNGEQLEEAEKKGLPVLVNLQPAQRSEGQGPYHSSRFIYDKQADEVICPQGRRIPLQRTRRKRGKLLRVYRSAKVCAGCPARAQCTRDRHGRTIDLAPGHEQIREMDRMLQDRHAAQLLQRRRVVVEPVFAQIKQNGGFRRWTMAGLSNVRGQWALLCSVWNLKVLYKNWRRELQTPSAMACANAMRPMPSDLKAYYSSLCQRMLALFRCCRPTPFCSPLAVALSV